MTESGQAVLAPPFEAARLLKRGHGIDTWLAREREGGLPVVVKTAPASTLSAAVLRRLELEASRGGEGRSVAGTAVRATLGTYRGVSYLVLPYVPGVSLDQRLAAGPLEVDAAIGMARDLLSSLREIHEANAVHGDVKPGNIIVSEVGPLGRATLIDFAFSRSVVALHADDEERAGTALYMAPEQAGLFGHGADARSDLYALGLTLFEALAGYHPLRREGLRESDSDPTLSAILRAHLLVTPPSLSLVAPEVPHALAEVVRRLLQKDPRDRYQTAHGVLADLDEIAAARRLGVREPSVLIGRSDRRVVVAEPVFVGRTRELARLDACLDRLQGGGGGLVRIEGVSGGGKSRLLSELRQRGLARSHWVVQTRGVEQSAQVPFRAFHDIAEKVLAATRTDPGFAEAVRARLEGVGPELVTALPELAALVAVAPASGQEEHLEVRTVAALATLLGALGTATRPAVVLVDDAQWIPEQTLRAVVRWLEDTDGPRHVLVVMSFRTGEVAPEHPLRAVGALLSLELAPLSGEEMRRLVVSMTGELPEEVGGLVERLSEGNPFLGTAVVQGLVETGALVPTETGWVVEPEAMRAAQASRRAATMLSRRLQSLVPSTGAALVAGAVLGRRFEVELAAVVAGCDLRAAHQAFTDARDRQIVWPDADGLTCTFVHDRLRETLLEGLSGEARRGLHQAAARALRELAGGDAGRTFEIAYHHDAAGEHAEALPFALAAAERARAGSDFETATRYYRIALRGAGEDPALRRRVSEALGDLALVGGRYDEAASHLESAASVTEGRLEQAHLQAKIGYLGHRRGDWVQSLNAFEKALQLTGQRVPRTRIGVFVALLGALFVQLGHSIFGRWVVGRRALDRGAADLLAVDIYCRLTHHYIMGRGPMAALTAHLRALNLAERYPPSWQLAYATVNHGLFMATLPWRRRAYAYADRAADMQRRLGDPWHLGMVLQLQAVVYQWTAQIARAQVILDEAAVLLRRVGDRWEAEVCDCLSAACLYRSGRLHEASELGRRVVASSRAGGSVTAFVHALGYWSKASGGKVPEEVVREAFARAAGQPHVAETAFQAHAVRLLGEGRPREAELELEEAAAIVRRLSLRSDLVAPIPCWLATSVRMQAASAVGAERKRLEARAARMSRRALRLARSFHNNLPHALREAGLVAIMRGRVARGRRYLAESVSQAKALGAAHEACLTRLAQAELDHALGATQARALAEAAQRELEVLRTGPEAAPRVPSPEARDLSLAERLETLLESGRGLISTFEVDTVLARALDTTRRLLRSDECAFGVLEADGTPRVLAGASFGISRSVVRDALAAGVAVVVNELGAAERGAGTRDAGSESVILSQARSVVCAPVHVRGETRHFLYVMSRQVAGLFGEDDRRIAQFVAALAGGALDNAEGYQRVQAAEGEIRRLSGAVGRAQEEERRRLAYALHDGAGQVLASTLIQLAELSRHAHDALERSRLADLSNQLRELLEEVRNLTHDLRPAALDRLGLAAALRELAERVSSPELCVTVMIEPGEQPPLDTELALPVFRVVQAALANVIRHAAARNASICLYALPDGRLRVEVEDDGVGFDTHAVPGDRGIGILGMRERASWIGGQLEVRSSPGGGTLVSLELPP